MGGDVIDMKLQVLHAALIETARLCHPRLGHTLDPDTWMKVFADDDFQAECNALVAAETKQGLFAKTVVASPSAEDYLALAQKHSESLSRWEQWGSVRAFFYALDADAALVALVEGPFLSELVMEVVLDDMADQVNRGYLQL